MLHFSYNTKVFDSYFHPQSTLLYSSRVTNSKHHNFWFLQIGLCKLIFRTLNWIFRSLQLDIQVFSRLTDRQYLIWESTLISVDQVGGDVLR